MNRGINCDDLSGLSSSFLSDIIKCMQLITPQEGGKENGKQKEK